MHTGAATHIPRTLNTPQPLSSGPSPSHLSSVTVYTGSGYPPLRSGEVFVQAKIGDKEVTAEGMKGVPLPSSLQGILILGVMADLSCGLELTLGELSNQVLEEGCCLWRLALAIRKIGCCGDDHPLCYYAASMTTEACELIEIIRIPSPLLSIEQLIRFQELVPKILHTAGQLRRDALLHYAANLVE